MTVPAVPGSGFAVIQAKFLLGALETLFDRPAQTGRAGQFRQCRSDACEHQVVGAL